MARPCENDHELQYARGDVYIERTCRLCWLYSNRDDYRAAWDAQRPTVRQPEKKVNKKTCRHAGDVLRTELCKKCGGSVKIKVFACELHGECSMQKEIQGIACCAKCPDYQGG